MYKEDQNSLYYHWPSIPPLPPLRQQSEQPRVHLTQLLSAPVLGTRRLNRGRSCCCFPCCTLQGVAGPVSQLRGASDSVCSTPTQQASCSGFYFLSLFIPASPQTIKGQYNVSIFSLGLLAYITKGNPLRSDTFF